VHFIAEEQSPLMAQQSLTASEAPPLIIQDELSQEITCAYLEAAESWRGCDWPMTFGSRRIELGGLKAYQARLLAEATSGEESQAWSEATCWLEQVEQDASDARSEASIALDLLVNQEWATAMRRLDKACALESQYHNRLVWGPLRDLIAAWNHGTGESGSTA
jgi:hypothetical protein